MTATEQSFVLFYLSFDQKLRKKLKVIKKLHLLGNLALIYILETLVFFKRNFEQFQHFLPNRSHNTRNKNSLNLDDNFPCVSIHRFYLYRLVMTSGATFPGGIFPGYTLGASFRGLLWGQLSGTIFIIKGNYSYVLDFNFDQSHHIDES